MDMFNLEDAVVKYQETRCNKIFDKIYKEVEPILSWKNKKCFNDGSSDIESEINLAVFDAVIKFDPSKNNNFKGYLNLMIGYRLKKFFSKSRKKREQEFTVAFEELDNNVILSVKDDEAILSEKSYLTDIVDMNSLDNIDNEIISLRLQGWKSVEIAQKLQISPSAVSQRIKKIKFGKY
jgi:RNA polymerase sigma factor (sigma-70 family)